MKKKNTLKNIIYGAHPVLAALQNPNRRAHELMVSKGLSPEIEAEVKQRPSLRIVKVTNEALDQLLGEDTLHQGLALKVDPLPSMHLENLLQNVGEKSCVIVLDQVSDPHNVGAILRSAAAFGADALIYQSMNAPDASNPTLIKSASGAVEVIPMIAVTNLARALEALKEAQYWCYGLDEQGASFLNKANLTGRVIFVMGREGKGLRPLIKQHCDALIKLPTSSHFSTLNVSNAAAVSLYEWMRQNVS